MSYLYKCNRRIDGKVCGARKSLKKKVEDYVHKPKCPSCGKELTYMDKWQMKKNKENTCHCDGLHFPHRAGSSVWCKESKKLPTEQDYIDRYGEA